MKRKLFLLLIPILGLSMFSRAQGDLLITPTRVVFEGNKQKADVNLVNVGKDTAIYTISFLQYNMTEDGSFKQIEKPDAGQMFADPYLRVFPRTITLAPGEPQVVMLQCRRKSDMVAGEYRSHLYFRAEKNQKPLGLEKRDSTVLSVQLIPIFGLSIPIIIRSGDVNVSSSLSDLKLETIEDTIHNMNLTINRTGNISIYGDITIQFIPTQGKAFEIGKVKGLGVYTNINKRNVSVRLYNMSGNVLKNGKLKVQYVSNDATQKTVTVYAESELEIK